MSDGSKKLADKDLKKNPRADAAKATSPTAAQKRWLSKGVDQAGGKLPLFDDVGREVSHRTIRACVAAGWAEPWFSNPIKPDWLVCKLTAKGMEVLSATGKSRKS